MGDMATGLPRGAACTESAQKCTPKKSIDAGAGRPRVKHPAQYTPALLPVMAEMLQGAGRILDPFAGLGNVFKLAAWLPGVEICGVEIEPEWAACDPRVTQGNALHLPWPAGYFDAVCTSPTYGNRLADHHRARDASRRHSYTHDLGRPLHPDNSGRLQWGEAYRDFHRQAWAEVRRVLEPGGRFVLNCKDHVRKGELVPVTAWHIETLQALGFVVVKWERVPCPGMRWGANHAARADVESVVLLRLDDRACADTPCTPYRAKLLNLFEPV